MNKRESGKIPSITSYDVSGDEDIRTTTFLLLYYQMPTGFTRKMAKPMAIPSVPSLTVHLFLC
jgi:hypothetical protein